MLVITQLVFLEPGKEAEFLAFEDKVLPLLTRHGGELLLRIRPSAESIVATEVGVPYEVHVVTFADEDGLTAYTNDPERLRWIALKETSVRAVRLYKATGV
jgi:antibiotic biosynthesis monooxygenase (ABM) superfamily enzyme